MSTESCGNCRFFRMIDMDKNSEFGKCARHAPMPVAVIASAFDSGETQQRFAVFPLVDYEMHWCGEYESRPVTPESTE